MKTTFGVLIAASLIGAAPATGQTTASAQAEDPAKLAEAHAVIDVIFPPNERESQFAKLQSDIIAQNVPALRAQWAQEPGVKKVLDDFLADAFARQRVVIRKHLPDEIDALASAYTREFSLAELKDIHAFARSASGRHYLSKSMSFVGDPAVTKANAGAMADMRAVDTQLIAELKEKMLAYLKAHPELAAKIKAERAGAGH